MCCAATIALLGLILLAVSPRTAPEETAAVAPGGDSPGAKVDRLPDDLEVPSSEGLTVGQFRSLLPETSS